MTSEEDFLQALQQGPPDDDLRLVYADWLEERGDIRGEYLRLLIQLRRIPQRLEELQSKIDPNWLMRLGCLFRLVLRSYRPNNKIQIIKSLRELTGLGLKEIKDLVERPLPLVIAEGLPCEHAERARQLLQEHADVVIEPDHGMEPGKHAREQCVVPDRFRLMLRSYRPQNKIWIIKSVRELTGLGLKEAKDLVERPLPQVIAEGLTREQAERARQSFADHADVSIEDY